MAADIWLILKTRGKKRKLKKRGKRMKRITTIGKANLENGITNSVGFLLSSRFWH